MSWVFAPELVELKLLLVSGENPSALSSSPLTRKRSSSSATQASLFSQTSVNSTGSPGVDAWISLLLDSPARTSALQEIATAWMESEAVFFSTWQESCEKSAPISYSLRTFQAYADSSARLKGKWPMRAMSVDGTLYPLPKWEPGTSAKDGSALLPTLTASEGGYNKGGAAGRKGKERPTLATMVQKGLLPTLTASEGFKSWPNQRDSKGNMTISALVRQDGLLTTLTVKGNYNRAGLSPTSGDGLITALHLNGGLLNPTWAEWYMGFPLDWTSVSEPSALKRLEIALYPRKAKKPSKD